MQSSAVKLSEPPVCPRCHKRNGEHLLVCDECGTLYGFTCPPIPWVCEWSPPGAQHRVGLAA